MLILEIQVLTLETLSKVNIIGLYCKRALLKRLYSAKETCNFEDFGECLDVGWLLLVGSLKLHVSFAEYSLFIGLFCNRNLSFWGAY